MAGRTYQHLGIQSLETRLPLTATLSVVTSEVFSQQVVEVDSELVGTQSVKMEVTAGVSQGGNSANEAPEPSRNLLSKSK